MNSTDAHDVTDASDVTDATDAVDDAVSLDQARALLADVRAVNEADLAAAQAKLDGMANDGTGSAGNMTDAVTAAQFMVDDASRILDEVTAAEGRLSAGTYGVCESCGQRIADARLRLRPYVRTCIACAA